MVLFGKVNLGGHLREISPQLNFSHFRPHAMLRILLNPSAPETLITELQILVKMMFMMMFRLSQGLKVIDPDLLLLGIGLIFLKPLQQQVNLIPDPLLPRVSFPLLLLVV